MNALISRGRGTKVSIKKRDEESTSTIPKRISRGKFADPLSCCADLKAAAPF
jgi:hypothetical protein